MGAWGFKALESDEGLDVTDFLERLYKGKTTMVLSEIISAMIEEEFLTDDRQNIDFFFDNSAMAVAELVVMFYENQELDYDHEEEDLSLRNKKVFEFDVKSLEYLLTCLNDIKDEKPDEDGERECVELWRDSDNFEEWKNHLSSLIVKLESIKDKAI